MKEFWSENGKYVGKMLINQFGATFFGIMLVMAASAAQSQRIWLRLFASCFSTLFYLYLIYNVLWEHGGQDRIRADAGRAIRKPLTGLWIAVLANIPNFIIAALIIVSQPFKDTKAWAVSLNVVGRALALLWEGMYAGIVATYSPINPIIHLLDIFPALFVAWAAYLLGLNNKRLLQPFELKQPAGKDEAKSGK
ncbi:MAG: hypothetical protein II889_14205 [Clostridia bacterium]|nr:hypothetical protein [Clostridia bacterium]MCR4905953.1 hypothetical protein [Clostridiales bacterium]